LIKADWKACQARILAHLSQGTVLIKLFNEGQDFHAATAQMFGLASRDEAKPINFGMIFGQGPRALAREVNKSWKERGLGKAVNEAQAASMIKIFFEQYAEIEPYFDREYETLVADKRLEKTLKNPLAGRIRRFRMRQSDKLKRIMKATLLQQVESHLLKLALVSLHSELKARNMKAHIVMAIHDALWVECPEREAEQIKHFMRRMMTTAGKLKVPLSVEME
jgi:DNA polymerase I